MDDKPVDHQCCQIHQPSPKGRLLPRDMGCCNLQHFRALPSQMSLGMPQNTEGEGTGHPV